MENTPAGGTGMDIELVVECVEIYRDIFMYGHTYSKSKDQAGKVANPVRGQLNRENEYFPVRVRA